VGAKIFFVGVSAGVSQAAANANLLLMGSGRERSVPFFWGKTDINVKVSLYTYRRFALMPLIVGAVKRGIGLPGRIKIRTIYCPNQTER
jgi:hypothetical protein